MRDEWSLLLTMLWIVGLPFFLLFGNRLPLPNSALKADRLTYALAAAPLLEAVVRRPRSLQRPGRIEVAMAVYLALIFVSWITTMPHKDVTVLKQDADFLLSCFMMPFTAFLLARNIDWTRESILKCLGIVVGVVGVYMALLGAVQYVYDWNFLASESARLTYPDRAKGPYESPGPYGIAMVLLVLLSLFLYVHSQHRLIRTGMVVVAVGLVEAIVACKMRAVWIALPAALLLPFVRIPRARALSLLLVAMLGAQVLIVPRVSDPWGMQHRLTQSQPLDDRVAVSATAANMIRHKPWFGFGFGKLTFNEYKADYYASWGDVSIKSAIYPNNPHNDFLNVLVLMGVIGLISYSALVGVISLELLRPRKDPFAADLALFVLSGFAALILMGLSHSAMHMSYAQILFFFLLGMVARGPRAATGEVAAPQVNEIAA